MTQLFIASAMKTIELPSIQIVKTMRIDLWEKNQVCDPDILSYRCISVIPSGIV